MLKKIILLFTAVVLQGLFSISEAQNLNSKTYVVFGKINEQKKGEPVIGAIVTAVGTGYGTVSDVMGEYRLELPNGTYTLECRLMTYKTVQIPNVVIQNQNIEINIILEDDAKEGSTLVIQDVRKTNNEAAVLMEMKEAKSVVSGMSAAQIAKTQDRDASQVARRIPGVTIVDNRFVMVRGLSSRYNSTMINGIIAPSLESDMRAFSFDIIPSMALDRFLIYKSPSADLPGEFAGGAINVITKNIPDDKLSIDFSYVTGYRQNATGQPFYTNVNDNAEKWGNGAASRSLSDNFVDNVRNVNSIDEKIELGKSLGNTWALEKNIADLDRRMSFTVGNRWKWQDILIGNYTAVNYSRTRMLQEGERMDYNEYDNVIGKSDTVFHYNDNNYMETTQLGVLNNWGLRWKTGSAEIKNFINQNGQQSNTLRNGINIEEGNYRKEYSMRYTQRLVYSAQAGFQQKVFNRRGNVSGSFGFGTTQKQDPDWKRIRYTKPTDGSDPNFAAYIPFSAQPFYMGRLFMDLNEYVRTYTLNYEHQMFATNKDPENQQWATIKGGMYLENKDRLFSSRNLGYAVANFMNFDFNMIYQPYDQILNDANINSTTGLTLDEDTRGADKYIAQNDLLATYLMTNIPYKNWNITAGVRREDNRQALQSADITGNPIEATIDSVVYLPSLNVSYNLSKKTLLRFAYGKTINRPEFREMAPFSFYDFDNNFIISGNPNIQFSTIKNIDLRWEHYPSTNEVVSAALFYKQFENPIEQYFVPGVGSGGTRSFMPDNALAATSYGAEIDVRKSMGEWINKPFAKNLVVVANGSYIVSNIELSAANIETGLNPNRPMVGQSPYIVNAGLYYDNDSTGWQVSALYNVIGPRIAIVGIPGVPEAYEMPRNVIDLTVAKNFDDGLGIRFGIQDLLNATSYMIQDANADGKLNIDDDQVIQRFNRGTYFTIGIQYKFRKK